MTVPLLPRIGALVLATTSFYAYVGQMVPQNEVQPPPTEIVIPPDLTTDQMVTVGRQIMDTKGLCFTCHTVGRTGALRFPDLGGVATRAAERVPGLSDVEYFAQSMYEPDAFVVPGFNPGMPVINRPPIGLTDQEILCVMAYLQSLGGTPTVTLQTSHRYYAAPAAPDAAPGAPPAAPGGAPAPAAPPAQGAAPGASPPAAPGGAPASAAPPGQGVAPGAPPVAPGVAPSPAAPAKGVLLRPDASSPDMRRDAHSADAGLSRTVVAAAGVPLDRYAAPNANFLLVAGRHSGPRRAERAQQILPTSQGRGSAGIGISRASPWLVVSHEAARLAGAPTVRAVRGGVEDRAVTR